MMFDSLMFSVVHIWRPIQWGVWGVRIVHSSLPQFLWGDRPTSIGYVGLDRWSCYYCCYYVVTSTCKFAIQRALMHVHVHWCLLGVCVYLCLTSSDIQVVGLILLRLELLLLMWTSFAVSFIHLIHFHEHLWYISTLCRNRMHLYVVLQGWCATRHQPIFQSWPASNVV